MIARKEYDRISKRWHGKVYQKYDKLVKRIPILLESKDVFKRAKVLEIGSNAGMYMYHIADVVESYYGIEPDKHYHDQARATLKFMDSPTNLHIENTTIAKFLDNNPFDYDTLLVSFVLHHLTSDELAAISDKMLPKCRTVVIHTRSGDPLKKGHDESGVDPMPIWDKSMVKQMIEKKGFEWTLKRVNKMHLIVCFRLPDLEKKSSEKTTSAPTTESIEEKTVAGSVDSGA